MRDGGWLAEAAHGAKGAVFHIGAQAAADLYRPLKVSARARDWAEIGVFVVESAA